MSRCSFEGCKTRAHYKDRTNPKSKAFCFSHKTESMKLHKHSYCSVENCEVTGIFYEHDKMIRFCSSHKPINAKCINTIHTCSYENCTSIGKYKIDESNKLYCAKHSGYSNKKLCLIEGCKKTRRWGLVGEKPEFCQDHKSEKMEMYYRKFCEEIGCKNVVSKAYSKTHCQLHSSNTVKIKLSEHCIVEDCTRAAIYGINNEMKYCKEHKSKEMTYLVKQRRCDECGAVAVFGKIGEKTTKCPIHKTAEMFNLRIKYCIHEGCLTSASYNYVNETTKLFCHEHMLPNMENKNSNKKSCIECGGYAKYGELNGKPVRCKEHRKENDINIITIGRICKYEGCNKIASFNFIDKPGVVFCSSHKDPQMICKQFAKKCQEDKCKELATFGIKDKYVQFCQKHAKIEMIDLIKENRCSILHCGKDYAFIKDDIKYCSFHNPISKDMVIIKRLCKYCDIEEESDYICNECSKIRNKKEDAIVKYLQRTIDTPFIHDSDKMLNGCSRRRPDVYFELKMHVVIVEIDENQHKLYENICECARINEIVNGVGGLPITFIRFNPDIIKNNGVIVNIRMAVRLKLLVKIIKRELEKIPENYNITLIQLFYDDNYETYAPYKDEIITDIVTR